MIDMIVFTICVFAFGYMIAKKDIFFNLKDDEDDEES